MTPFFATIPVQTKAHNSGKTYRQSCRCGSITVSSVTPIKSFTSYCCRKAQS